MNDFSIMNSEFYIPLSKRSKKNGLRVKITQYQQRLLKTIIILSILHQPLLLPN